MAGTLIKCFAYAEIGAMGIDIESYVENGVEINFSLLSIEELYFWNIEIKLLFIQFTMAVKFIGYVSYFFRVRSANELAHTN